MPTRWQNVDGVAGTVDRAAGASFAMPSASSWFKKESLGFI
jgi:hypothetical protein